MISRTANTTAALLDAATLPAIPISVASLNQKAINHANKLPNSHLKETIKGDNVAASSLVNTFASFGCFLPAMSVFLKAWPYLSTGQRLVVAITQLTAIGLSAYSLAEFWNEDVMTKGIITSTSCTLFRISQALGTKFASDERHHHTLLGNDNPSATGLDSGGESLRPY